MGVLIRVVVVVRGRRWMDVCNATCSLKANVERCRIIIPNSQKQLNSANVVLVDNGV